MNRKITILFICLLFMPGISIAENISEIQNINRKVALIEKQKGELSTLELKLHTGEFESSPPEMLFYFKNTTNDLIMAEVSVGHEVFVTKHSYYFEKKRILKYIKETLNHPDSPPKQAVIYSESGEVIWSNMASPIVSSKTIIDIFDQNIKVLRDFSKY